MEIKRKFELLIETNRRYVIRQSSPDEKTACAQCGEPMLRVEQAANLFGIRQRRIFQIIEVESAHFIETEAGAVMICITSLKETLDNGKTLMPAESSR